MLSGSRYFLDGFRLIGLPGLRRYVVMPLVLNILIFLGLIWFAADEFGDLLNWLLAKLPDWMDWLRWLLWPLFALLSALIMFYSFTLVANLIGAPFNGLLSARVEQHLTGKLPPEGARGLWVEMAEAIVGELRKLGYFLIWALAAAGASLILMFIPVLNAGIPVLWFVIGAWFLALEYADYPLGNRSLSFPEQRVRLRARSGTALSFGAVATLATMVPILNFFVMPAAVAGATAWWVAEDAKASLAER